MALRVNVDGLVSADERFAKIEEIRLYTPSDLFGRSGIQCEF